MAATHQLPKGNPWSSLSQVLAEETLDVVEQDFGFTHLTAVQAATIPAFLSNKDVLVQAVTGSGKTLAFVIPTIEILTSLPRPLEKQHIGAIILTPTRELAQQIHTIMCKFVAKVPIAGTAETGRPQYLTKPALCIGGKNQDRELADMKLHGANIIIGTPGRMDQILSQQLVFDPSTLELLILDEADRLLDAGFQVNITAILKRLPKQRRTGLFSATLTQQIEHLSKVGLRNPVKITLKVQYKDTNPELANALQNDDNQNNKQQQQQRNGGEKEEKPTHQAIPTTLTNYYHVVQPEHKILHLIKFLYHHMEDNIIVFFMTCAEVDYFYRVLSTFPPLAQKYNVFNHEMIDTVGLQHMIHKDGTADKTLFCALHGQMNQSKRNRTYEAYKQGTIANREQKQQTDKSNNNNKKAQGTVLFCTDVAARGIDVDNIDWVLQIDAPQHPDAFIHRIGRCARAGQRGNALTWLLESEQGFVELMKTKNVPFIDYQTTFDDEKKAEFKNNIELWDRTVWSPCDEQYFQSEKEDVKKMEDDNNDGDDEDNEEEDKLVHLTTNTTKTIKQLTNITPLPSCFENKKIIPYNTYKVLVQKKENRKNFKAETKKSVQTEQVAYKKQQEAQKAQQERNAELPPFTKVIIQPPKCPSLVTSSSRQPKKNDSPEKLNEAINQAIALFIPHARWCNSYDKYLFEICQKAYVSHINAYKEHVAKFTFPFDSLLFVHVAMGFGMLFLPVLHDLKKYALIWPHLTRLSTKDIKQYHNTQINEIKTVESEKRKEKQHKQIEQRKQNEKEKRKEREFNEKQRAKKTKNRTKTTFDEMEKEWFDLGDELRQLKKQKKNGKKV